MCSDDSKRVSMVHHGDSIKSIYQASLASVSPSKLVKDVLHFDKGKGLLKAGQKCYKIDRNVVGKYTYGTIEPWGCLWHSWWSR